MPTSINFRLLKSLESENSGNGKGYSLDSYLVNENTTDQKHFFICQILIVDERMGLEPSSKLMSMKRCTKFNQADDDDQITKNYNDIFQNKSVKVTPSFKFSAEQQISVLSDIESSMTVPTMLSKLFELNPVPSMQLSVKQNNTNNDRTKHTEIRIAKGNHNDGNGMMETKTTLVQLPDAELSRSESTKSNSTLLNILIPTRSTNDEDDSKFNETTFMTNTRISDGNDSYTSTFVSNLYSTADMNNTMLYNIP